MQNIVFRYFQGKTYPLPLYSHICQQTTVNILQCMFSEVFNFELFEACLLWIFSKKDRFVLLHTLCTNCAPLLTDLILYSYESEFLDNMIRGGHRKLARSFNLRYRYIDDLIVFNNKTFGDYVKEIYPSQLTVEKANTKI